MAQHILSLEAPDTMNLGILRIVDTSVYSDIIPISCPTLSVTLPGFKYSVEFTEPVITPGFIVNLTACNLQVQSVQCGTLLNNLPDGVYIIKYSVSPNDQVFVEYNHLRITFAMQEYQKLLCQIDLGTCDPPQAIKDKLNKLRMIQMYLQAAKAKVEVCHEPQEGMQLYTYALKLLNKMGCKTCK
jgi:hypothetical protein